MAACVLLTAAFAGAAGQDGLHQAVRAGDIGRVKALLVQGVSVNERDNLGGTPLHDACWAGDLGIVELLIEKGAEIDAAHIDINSAHAESGSTPLHLSLIHI